MANIANGNELIVGNPNPDVIDSAGAPETEFEDLRIYDRALSDQQVSALATLLKYHWTFREIQNSVTQDTIRDLRLNNTPSCRRNGDIPLGQGFRPLPKGKIGF